MWIFVLNYNENENEGTDATALEKSDYVELIKLRSLK
jgi:hypothetical protein